jgi:hypothetical protein
MCWRWGRPPPRAFAKQYTMVEDNGGQTPNFHIRVCMSGNATVAKLLCGVSGVAMYNALEVRIGCVCGALQSLEVVEVGRHEQQ